MVLIKRASELTGVPEATLRIWERRYGVGATRRSDSGYRIYDTSAIFTITQMKRLIEQGWSAQLAADEVLARLSSPGAKVTKPDSINAENLPDALRARFFHAIEALDSQLLTRVLDEAFASGSFEFVVDHWLTPTLSELGRRWTAGETDIASEHFASNSIMRRLGNAYESAGQSNEGTRIVIGAPSGSKHEMGALAFAVAMRRHGFHVVFLGIDVPADSWVEACHRHQARAVAISVPMPSDIESAQKCVDALRLDNASTIIIVGGGSAYAVEGSDVTLTGNLTTSSEMLAKLLN
ncbi:MAG: cobalamin B12-binding domain-containing protein [Actinobacteria bacterium]|nr:cobalamin B12-binding domain-containing protein [Actinomycetota bacterium]